MSDQEVRHIEDRNTTAMFRIHPLQTGCVQIKSAQRRRRRGGPARVLLDHAWSEWLPIHAWAIEHPEGVIVVDTGETARTSEPGYFPRWHPFYRTSARINVAPEQEIGPQLRHIGIEPEQVRTVVLTHLHTDHAGGLHHFPNSEILVSGKDYRNAQGMLGRLEGYLPRRWPEWFSPTPIRFQPRAFGPFRQSYALTAAGDVTVVPTPGHTPHHVSVIAKADGVSYFLAGDTSYNEALLVERVPDGVSPRAKTAVRTLETILSYTAEEPTVYFPRTIQTPPSGCEIDKPYPRRQAAGLRTIEIEPSGDARTGLARVAHAPLASRFSIRRIIATSTRVSLVCTLRS